MAIHFYCQQVKNPISQKRRWKSWIKETILAEGKTLGNISYIFCTDDALLEINQQFLQHDTYTDIITFDYSEENAVSGEIYVSTERVKENASSFQVSFEQELSRVVIHGVLHLCGYKDKKKEDVQIMRRKEDIYISNLNLISSQSKK